MRGHQKLAFTDLIRRNSNRPIKTGLDGLSRFHESLLALNKTGNLGLRINVTMSRIRATIVAVEKNEYYTFWACVCSLSYPTCNVHSPYYNSQQWPVWLCHVFPSYLISGTVLRFSLQIFSEIFLILGRTELHMIKNVHRYWRKVPVILVRF